MGTIRSKRRDFSWLGIGLALALGVAACGGTAATSGGASQSAATSSPATPTVVRTGYQQAVTLLPIHVAQAQGFFAKHGLKVDETLSTDTQMQTSSLDRQYDITMQTPSGFLSAAAQGLDIVAVAGTAVNTAQTPNTYLMTNQAGIQTLKDLVGKRVGVPSPASISAVSLNYLALKQGLGTNQFRFINVPFQNMADQLKAGNIDAATPVVPYSTLVQAQGARSILTPTVEATRLATGTDRSANAFFISTRTYAQQHPAVISAWRASVADAIDWIQANPTAAVNLAQEWTQLPMDVIQNTPMSTFSATVTVGDIQPFALINYELGTTPSLQDATPLVLG